MLFGYSNTLYFECAGTIFLVLSLYISSVNTHSSKFNGYGIINVIISLFIIAVKLYLNHETFYIRLVKTYWIHILSLLYHSYNILVIINIINNIIFIFPKNSINNIQEADGLIFMSNTVYYQWIFYNHVYFVALIANITIAFSESTVLYMYGKDE
jgi:hypothetical protein